MLGSTSASPQSGPGNRSDQLLPALGSLEEDVGTSVGGMPESTAIQQPGAGNGSKQPQSRPATAQENAVTSVGDNASPETSSLVNASHCSLELNAVLVLVHCALGGGGVY
ncbi:hypothetical protein ACHAWF_014814 [Thalassiosira exigua]